MAKMLKPVSFIVTFMFLVALALIPLASVVSADDTWIDTVGDALGMDEYRYGEEDFCWTHSGFNSSDKEIISATLEIRAEDVDWEEGPDGEHNIITVDGYEIGELVGEDDEWSVTVFNIKPSLAAKIFSNGKAQVCIDIDSTHGPGYYATEIDWSRFTIKWGGGNPMFTNSGLIVSPSQVYPDNTISISVNVSNMGGAAGNRVIDLIVNGVKEQSRTIRVEPNSSQRVEFSISKSTAGTYNFYCGGIPGQFYVISGDTVIHQGPTAAQTYTYDNTGGLGTGGIIAIVIIGILVIAGIIVVIVMTRR